MREEGGRILLMDFGLTHERDGRQKSGGTLGYMAPELLAGEPASVSSDIYALGVLLFHLLTGKYPVEDGPRRTVLDERPDLPVGLARVVETAMDPDPARRYSSAGQMITALSPPISQRPKSHRLRLWLLVAAAVVALALVIPPVRNLLLPSAKTVESSSAAARIDYLKAHHLLEHYYKPHAIETAMRLLEKTRREDPNFAPAFADLGRANFLQFRYLRDTTFIEPARKNCQQALALKPDLASVHVTLGMLNSETGQYDLASQELDEALRIDKLNAEAYAAISTLRKNQGRSKDVESELQKAIDLAPLDWRWPYQLGEYYVTYVGKLSEAVELYRKAAQLTPDNARVYNNLGITYWMLRRLPEAKEALEKAIRLEPGFNRFTNLGMVITEQGKYAESVPMFQPSIDLNAASPRPWLHLAYAYSHSGSSEAKVRETYLKAIELSDQVRKQRPKDASMLADLGTAYAAIAMESQAGLSFRQALALAPDNPEIMFLTGSAYEQLHHRDEALRWFEKAVEPKYPIQAIETVPELNALRADPQYLAI